jgi:4-hydroxy-tetrahydrodipicolinate synthase
VLTPKLVEHLAEFPEIVGLKDSSGDFAAFEDTRRRVSPRPDFAMLMGDEKLIADAVLKGAAGGVSGGANVAPELFSKMWQAAKSGDVARTQQCQERVIEFGRIYSIGRRWGRHIANLKFALSLMGICNPWTAAPLAIPTMTDQAAIAAWLDEISLVTSTSRLVAVQS